MPKLDLQYLTACKAYSIIPNFLRFKLYKALLTNTEAYRDFQRKLLDDECKCKEATVEQHKSTLQYQTNKLQHQINTIDFHALKHFLSLQTKKYEQIIQQTHDRKFKVL